MQYTYKLFAYLELLMKCLFVDTRRIAEDGEYNIYNLYNVVDYLCMLNHLRTG